MIFQNLQKPVFMARMAVQQFCVPVTSSLQIPHAMWLGMFTDFLPLTWLCRFSDCPPFPPCGSINLPTGFLSRFPSRHRPLLTNREYLVAIHKIDGRSVCFTFSLQRPLVNSILQLVQTKRQSAGVPSFYSPMTPHRSPVLKIGGRRQWRSR